MADDHTPEQRKYNMSQIKRKNTKPELIVRKFLFSKGLRYRIDDNRFPGRPDLIFPKYRVAVYVNGCFWHHHDCKWFVWPKTNTAYWIPKIRRNEERDLENYEKMESLGWNVLVVWECELRQDNLSLTLERLYEKIISFNHQSDV